MISDLETRMRAAAADLDFEEAARLRDEIKRLRATELAVTDDPTAKFLPPSPRWGEGIGGLRPPSSKQERDAEHRYTRFVTTNGPRAAKGKVHKPGLDEMGIALYHEMKPARSGGKNPRKPDLDEMGPGVEFIPGKRQEAGSAGGATGTSKSGPRSTLGRPGMHGGWKPSRRR